MTAPENDAAAKRSLTTVLVDDLPEMRELMRAVLNHDGRFDIVGEAADGLEAIRVVRETQPDLAVLDIAMPRMDGIAALPGLREASPTTRVVMRSSLPADQMAKPALEKGAVGYIEKGEDIKTLASRLHELASVLHTIQRVLDTAYSSDLSSPRRARSDLRSALASKASPSTTEIVELLTTELVTNAIRHASGEVTVTAEVSEDRIRVAVGDQDLGLPKPRQAEDHHESGRGLLLVEKLATRWGIEALPTGKIVWFETAV